MGRSGFDTHRLADGKAVQDCELAWSESGVCDRIPIHPPCFVIDIITLTFL
jgi:hypothetical protein